MELSFGLWRAGRKSMLIRCSVSTVVATGNTHPDLERLEGFVPIAMDGSAGQSARSANL